MESSKRALRACEACKRRKVKCNGNRERCQQCSHLNLHCIYTAPKTPRAPVRCSRNGVIEKYKQEVGQSRVACNDRRPVLPRPEPETQYNDYFFLGLVPSYEKAVYISHPIVNSAELRNCIYRMGDDQEAKAFVFASAAITLTLSTVDNQWTPNLVERIRDLAYSAITLLGPIRINANVTVLTVLTSLFIHNCLFPLGHPSSAFLYLRQATSMIEVLRVGEGHASAHLSTENYQQRLRLYWLLFIQERFVAISERQSTSLFPISELPQRVSGMPYETHRYFLRLIELFKLIDKTFIQHWVEQNHSTVRDTGLSSAWVMEKCRELLLDSEVAEMDFQSLNTMQQADLTITRHWLVTHVWRIAMSNGLLETFATDDCLSLLFPIQLSNRLRREVSNCPIESIAIHGHGIVKKLFQLSDTVADVILRIPAFSVEDSFNRLDDLIFLLKLTFGLPNLEARQKEVLGEKLEKLQQLSAGGL